MLPGQPYPHTSGAQAEPTIEPRRSTSASPLPVSRAEMSEPIDGELDERIAAQVARRARWCPNCRHMLKDLRRTVEGLQALDAVPTPADKPPA